MEPNVIYPIINDFDYNVYLRDVDIKSVEDVEVDDPYDYYMKGKQFKIDYAIEINSVVWKLPFIVDIVNDAFHNDNLVVRIFFDNSYSMIKRQDNFGLLIKSVLLMDGITFTIENGFIKKAISKSSLLFENVIEKALLLRNGNWSIIYQECQKDDLIWQLFYEKQPNYEECWFFHDEHVEGHEYPYGKYTTKKEQITFGYVVIPSLHNKVNKENFVCEGRFNDCINILNNHTELNKLHTERIKMMNAVKEAQRRKAEREERDYYYNKGWKSDYFDAITDGQYGDYDDFNGDFDSLEDSMGY